MTAPAQRETVDVATLRRMQAAAYSERQLQDEVMELALDLGWKRVHFRPAKTEHGWRTAVQGDGEGFPDTLLLRGTRGIAVEMKRQNVTAVPAEQLAWLESFRITGWTAYVWRPLQLLDGTIARVLT